MRTRALASILSVCLFYYHEFLTFLFIVGDIYLLFYYGIETSVVCEDFSNVSVPRLFSFWACLVCGMFSLHTGSVASSDSGHSTNSSGDGTTLAHSYQPRCPSPPRHPQSIPGMSTSKLNRNYLLFEFVLSFVNASLV